MGVIYLHDLTHSVGGIAALDKVIGKGFVLKTEAPCHCVRGDCRVCVYKVIRFIFRRCTKRQSVMCQLL